LRFDEIYDVYDGPRLFSASSTTGTTLLAFWIAEHTDGDEWLYVPISRVRLDEVVEGVLPLRSAFADPEDGVVFRVRTCFDGSSEIASTPPALIEERLFPPADDRLQGMRISAGVLESDTMDVREVPALAPLKNVTVPREYLAGRIRQKLNIERRKARPVAFEAVTAVLARWRVFFEHVFEAVGGRSDQLVPLLAEPGSFKFTLTLPKGRTAERAFETVRDFVDRIEANAAPQLDPRTLDVDLKEFEALVATLREHELMLTIEQEPDRTTSESSRAVVLDLRVETFVANRAQEAAAQYLASSDIPQADDLSRVLRLIELMSQNTDVNSESLDVTDRQVNYYKHACRVLRLLDDDNALTTVGQQVVSLTDTEAQYAALAMQFETSICGWRWVQWSHGKTLLDVQSTSAEAFLGETAPILSQSTARRRSRTLQTWCERLQEVHLLKVLRSKATTRQ
jgi:hypothetical protein